MKRRPATVHGVVVVDKPMGMTSHDVVGAVRKKLRERRVGHAGTLDPMATGVLVVLIGEATKLASYLTAEDKTYEATVRLGSTTTSGDADGEVITTTDLPAWLVEELSGHGPRIDAALAAERERSEQVPPAVSAIKVDGQRSYALARRGEAAELPPRPVVVRELTLQHASVHPPELRLCLRVSKGYYVRSLAHDLGVGLGVGGHLTHLRRTASGAFTLAHAVGLDVLDPSALIPVAEAARCALPAATLTEHGVLRARRGQLLAADDFVSPSPNSGAAGWYDQAGELVAVGGPSGEHHESEYFRVLRGFTAASLPSVASPVGATLSSETETS